MAVCACMLLWLSVPVCCYGSLCLCASYHIRSSIYHITCSRPSHHVATFIHRIAYILHHITCIHPSHRIYSSISSHTSLHRIAYIHPSHRIHSPSHTFISCESSVASHIFVQSFNTSHFIHHIHTVHRPSIYPHIHSSIHI